jgi:hypothetical protein
MEPQMEICTQVGPIADISAKVNSLDKDINGNGRKGIKEIVFRMDETLVSVVKTVDRIEKNQLETKEIFEQKLASLEKVQTVKTTEDEVREKLAIQRKIHNRWLLGIVVSLAIFVAGLIYENRNKTARLKTMEETIIQDNKVPDSTKKVIENEIK